MTIDSAVYREIFKNSTLGMIILDIAGNVQDINFAVEWLLGYQLEVLKNTPITDLCLPEDAKIDDLLFEELIQGQCTYFNSEKRYIRHDGTIVWILQTSLLVRDSNQLPKLVLMLEDVSARKTAESHLNYVSTHDSLTELYNRAHFDTEYHRLQFSSAFPISLVLIDVDGLKTLNDTKGHEAGDLLLKNVATILKAAFGFESIISRLGGDEFVIILPNMDSEQLAAQIQKLECTRTEFNLSSDLPEIIFSTGSVTASNALEISNALSIADQRMYEQKQIRKRSTTNQ